MYEDSMYLAEYNELGHVRRLRLSDGVELACSPELFVPGGGVALLEDCLIVTNDGLTSVLHAQTLQLMRSFESRAWPSVAASSSCLNDPSSLMAT